MSLEGSAEAPPAVILLPVAFAVAGIAVTVRGAYLGAKYVYNNRERIMLRGKTIADRVGGATKEAVEKMEVAYERSQQGKVKNLSTAPAVTRPSNKTLRRRLVTAKARFEVLSAYKEEGAGLFNHIATEVHSEQRAAVEKAAKMAQIAVDEDTAMKQITEFEQAVQNYEDACHGTYSTTQDGYMADHAADTLREIGYNCSGAELDNAGVFRVMGYGASGQRMAIDVNGGKINIHPSKQDRPGSTIHCKHESERFIQGMEKRVPGMVNYQFDVTVGDVVADVLHTIRGVGKGASDVKTRKIEGGTVYEIENIPLDDQQKMKEGR